MKRIVCILMVALAFAPAGAIHGEENSAGKDFHDKFWPAVSLPHTKIILSSKLDEKIESVAVKEGQTVKKGDVLVQFDSRLIQARIAIAEVGTDFEARLQSARVRSEYLQREFERSKNLKQFITESDLEKARYETEAARLELVEMQRAQTLAQRQLAYLRAEAEDYVIRAPLDGVVSHVWIEPGEMARQGQQLVEVMDPGVIEVRVHLKEQYAGHVKAGQRIVARFGPAGDREFSGAMDVVAPYIDSSSGTFMVRALVQPGEGAAVKPGMGCEVRFLSPGETPAGVSQAK